MSNCIQKFLKLIPNYLSDNRKSDAKDFSRNRKLPLPQLITFVLSLVTSCKHQGVDSQIGSFMRDARRSGIWPEADAVHRSAVTKSRKKVEWTLFEDLFQRAVKLSDEVFPEREEHLWHGMRAIAYDGSKYLLPASEEIRTFFDPESGLGKKNNGSGHYPTCLVSTAYDVLRQIPIARSVVPMETANEREEAVNLLSQIPQGNVLLFDRGYPSFDMFLKLYKDYNGFYLFRCPATSTFPVVMEFMQSGQEEAIIELAPTKSYSDKVGVKMFRATKPIRLRVIKLVSPSGEVSALLTNLLDTEAFPLDEIIKLYFKRWGVETHYLDEKKSMEIEQFHSRSVNGIKQELFAVLIMCVIARTLSALAMPPINGEKTIATPQFKHAITTLAADAMVLVADKPEVTLKIFGEILDELRRVKYYKPKTPKKSQPRVSKRPTNKWQDGKQKRIAEAAA